jgi:chromate transport protein ChrA
MATKEMFDRKPEEVWRWYLYRFGVCRAAQPNAGHAALVALEQRLGTRFTLITQNIDGLHRRAGSKRVFAIHGDAAWVRCAAECGLGRIDQPDLGERATDAPLSATDRAALTCPRCGGWLRPHVLWFDECYDEENYSMDSALRAAAAADLLQALVRIARRSLQSSLHVTLAFASFVALEFARVPFPVVLLVAAAVGAYLARQPMSKEGVPVSTTPARAAQTVSVVAVGLVLWLIPLLIVIATLGGSSLWTAIYLFFTKAALVTFGGAYAVLGYVTNQLVDKLAWVTADQSVAGLALAETTPGPLIIVLQFMGFMAGWNQPGPLSPLGSALLAGALATWATFLPSFLFILLGAPYVERLTGNARIEGALGAITAAVVGVIATLVLLLAQVVVLPGGWRAAPDWNAVLIALAAWFLLERVRWSLGPVLLAAAAGGLFLRLLQQ